MGVNFEDVRYVVNWGPARNLLDQLQEAGRAGWDGKRSHVVIGIMHSNSHNVSKVLKTLLKVSVALYKSFDRNIKSVSPGHDCCSHCAMECCNNRHDEKLPVEKSEPLACNSPPVLNRVVSDIDKEDLKEALAELVNGGSHNAFGAVSCHGF